jgi:hypothetical protein
MDAYLLYTSTRFRDYLGNFFSTFCFDFYFILAQSSMVNRGLHNQFMLILLRLIVWYYRYTAEIFGMKIVNLTYYETTTRQKPFALLTLFLAAVGE